MENKDLEVISYLNQRYIIVTKRYGIINYWAPYRAGYVDEVYQAGLYTREDATDIMNNNNCGYVHDVKDMDFKKRSNYVINYLEFIQSLANSKWGA